MCSENLEEKINKESIYYGIKFRAFPNEKQVFKIDSAIGCSRFIYNYFKSYKDTHYELYKEGLSLGEAKFMLTHFLKPSEEFSFLKDVDKFVLESSIDDLFKAYDRFFKGLKSGSYIGFPKFKSKRYAKQSYRTSFTNNNIELIRDENKNLFIKLPKVGKVSVSLNKNNPNIKKLLNNESKILNATITKTTDGKFYISLGVQEEVEKVVSIKESKQVNGSKIIAGDLGIKTLLTTYDGSEYKEYENLKYFKKNLKKLRRLQQSLSRKQKDSKNYIKARKKVYGMHQKIANQRLDYNHKLSRAIVNENQVYISEDLAILNMVKNHKLAREILSCGWGQLINFIEYKIKRKGGLVIKINRFYPSSKLCHACGHKYDELTLDERDWVCPNCGTLNPRDKNASFNLRSKGIEELIKMGISII